MHTVQSDLSGYEDSRKKNEQLSNAEKLS